MFTQNNHATPGSHVALASGTVFLNKYQVVQQAGTGNFARVFECINIHTKERVAVKILKKGYERDADFECDVLKGVSRHDPNDESGIVRLIERTEWNGQAVIVFKLKGAPLRNVRMPLAEASLKEITADVATALGFLHFVVKAVHTDLKPENVLAELSETTKGRKWVVCDLGSASFYKEGQLDRDLITTRPYRAPEVVLNRGWSFPSDAWSLGCILYELRTGKKLFDCHTDGDHLRMMEERLGPIPSVLKGNVRVPTSFSRCQTIHQEFRSEPLFLSLLAALLEYDPSRRMRCDNVTKHEYYTTTKSSAASAQRLDGGMQGLSVNDENRASTGLSAAFKRPMSISTSSSSCTGLNMPTQSTQNSRASNSLLPKTLSDIIGQARSGSSSGRRKLGGDDELKSMIPMTERPSFPSSLNYPTAFPASAPGSANSSPNRRLTTDFRAPTGPSSARSSPHRMMNLMSPLYPTASSNTASSAYRAYY